VVRAPSPRSLRRALGLRRLRSSTSPDEETFRRIYLDGTWTDALPGMPRSGRGALPERSAAVIAFIRDLIGVGVVRSIVDIGCGDLTYIREIPEVTSGRCRYVGCDIVPELIRDHRALSWGEFHVADVTTPGFRVDADLVLLKDVLFHLTNEQALQALQNLRRSRWRWLVATSSAINSNAERAFDRWHFAPLNLTLPPFNLIPARALSRPDGGAFQVFTPEGLAGAQRPHRAGQYGSAAMQRVANSARRRLAGRRSGEAQQRVAELERRVAELEQRLDHERLYPLEWANRRVRDRFGNRVQSGPFAGLAYPDWAMSRVDLFSPKVLGSFERELHTRIDSMVAAQPRIVINIGAAEGYYAVGLARRLPAATVLAYEQREDLRADLQAIAELNEVSDRVCIEGHCDLDALAGAVSPGALVVCDCEGCETALLDPEAVPELGSCDLLVEAHDLLVPEATATLEARFAGTHAIETIAAQPRYVDELPELGFLPLVTAQLAISEFRTGPMQWLTMRPRAGGLSPAPAAPPEPAA
jgi:SAM-dependent methyltransferase